VGAGGLLLEDSGALDDDVSTAAGAELVAFDMAKV
jgi:hypothetical protein